MLNDPETEKSPMSGDASHSWGADAPKGGRAVVQRILKEGAKGPTLPLPDAGHFAAGCRLQQHHLPKFPAVGA